MKEFVNFKWLFSRLTQNEVKTFMKYISLSNENDRGKISHSVSNKLIKLIKDDSTITEYHIQMALYGGIKTHAFRKLLQRAEEKLLDVILLQGSIANNDHYDERASDIIQMRKRLLQFDMLWLRGSNERILAQLDKIIEKADKYEYYEILLFSLYKKRKILSVSMSKREYENLNHHISSVEIKRKGLIEAEEILYGIGNRSFKLRSNNHEWVSVLERYTLQLAKLCREVNSRNIELCYRYIEIEYLDCLGDLYHAMKKSNLLLEYLDENEAVFSNMRFENALLNLINYKLKCYYFEDAQSQLGKVGKIFSKHYYNHFILCQISYFVELSVWNVTNLKKVLSTMNNLLVSKVVNTEFFLKFKYFTSIFEYLSSMDKNIELLIKRSFSSDLPDEKWKFAQRVFQIQLLIEAEKFELADVQIENNRKYMERMKKNDVLSKRQALIGKILVDLSRKSYDFRKVWKSRAKEFALLDSAEPEYRWQIMSPELIVFHEWFQSRLRLEVYDHAKVMQRMKEKISPLVQKPLLTLPSNGGRKHNRGVSSGSKREELASA